MSVSSPTAQVSTSPTSPTINIHLVIDPRVFDAEIREVAGESLLQSLPLSIASSATQGSPSAIDVRIYIRPQVEANDQAQASKSRSEHVTYQNKSPSRSPLSSTCQPQEARLRKEEPSANLASPLAPKSKRFGEQDSIDKVQAAESSPGPNSRAVKPLDTKRPTPRPFKPFSGYQRPAIPCEEHFPSVVPVPPKPTKELPTRYPRFVPTSFSQEIDNREPIPLEDCERADRQGFSTPSPAPTAEAAKLTSEQSSPGTSCMRSHGLTNPPPSPISTSQICLKAIASPSHLASSSDAEASPLVGITDLRSVTTHKDLIEPRNGDDLVSTKPPHSRHPRPASDPTPPPRHIFPRQFEELPHVVVERGPDGLAINSAQSLRQGILNLPFACNLEAGDRAWTEPIMFKLPIQETSFGSPDQLGFTQPLSNAPDGRMEIFIDPCTQECMRKSPRQAFLVPIRYINCPEVTALPPASAFQLPPKTYITAGALPIKRDWEPGRMPRRPAANIVEPSRDIPDPLIAAAQSQMSESALRDFFAKVPH